MVIGGAGGGVAVLVLGAGIGAVEMGESGLEFVYGAGGWAGGGAGGVEEAGDAIGGHAGFGVERGVVGEGEGGGAIGSGGGGGDGGDSWSYAVWGVAIEEAVRYDFCVWRARKPGRRLWLIFSRFIVLELGAICRWRLGWRMW